MFVWLCFINHSHLVVWYDHIVVENASKEELHCMKIICVFHFVLYFLWWKKFNEDVSKLNGFTKSGSINFQQELWTFSFSCLMICYYTTHLFQKSYHYSVQNDANPLYLTIKTHSYIHIYIYIYNRMVDLQVLLILIMHNQQTLRRQNKWFENYINIQ